MMINNEVLSQPVAFDYQIAGACVSDYPNPCGKWVGWQVELSRECPPDWMVEEGKVKDLRLRYSQEYVTALIQRATAAEQREEHLKASVDVMGQRIAELECANAAQDDHINQQQDRIDTLENRNGEIGKYARELERRLQQQPIKLPN